MTIPNRMNQLICQLREASRAYYNENREIMSDRAYDALYDELLMLEAQTGIILSNSPTQQVGYEVVEGLAKVSHDRPMLSLDKTKEPAKLAAFLGTQQGCLSWKLDGLSLVLKYDGGRFIQAITRGNGLVGEDVSHNAKVFANIPLKVSYTEAFSVRGEAVITNADFERIVKTETHYKNPRNLCSGTVRQLDNKISAKRQVRYYAVGLVNGGENFVKKSEQLAWLAAQGFEVVEYSLVQAKTVETQVALVKEQIESLPVASDGLVLTYDDINYSESLGATSKFPRDSIAFKWADEITETKLRYIEWNTSRTGLINPIAVFDPVEIEGSTVNRASLHNVSILRGLELGEGDTITVYKANMIIPQVAENLTRSNTIIIPSHCPVCGFGTEVLSASDGGDCEALYCMNPNCQAQLVSALTHFTGRDAMNIEGLSEQTLEKLVENEIVADYTDLFFLDQYEETILQMEGFGRKSYTNLLASVERAKDAALPNFIYALGIKHVGLANAKLLCAHFEHDLARIRHATEEELVEIKGFGEAIAHSLHLYFNDERNLNLLEKAKSFLRFTVPETAQGTLNGLIIVITGDLVRFANRKALQNLIENHGGRITSTVTSKTSFLINNDMDSVSGKNKKAAELKVEVLSEDAFLEKFGFAVNA